jgi:hypothetical protein
MKPPIREGIGIHTIRGLIERASRLYPHRPFFKLHTEDGGFEEINYRDFQAQLLNIATGFYDLGLRKGDQVGLVGKNSHLWATEHKHKVTSLTLPLYKEINPLNSAWGGSVSAKISQYWRCIYAIFEEFGEDCQYEVKYPILIARGGPTDWVFTIEGKDYLIDTSEVSVRPNHKIIPLEELEDIYSLEDDLNRTIEMMTSPQKLEQIWENLKNSLNLPDVPHPGLDDKNN